MFANVEIKSPPFLRLNKNNYFGKSDLTFIRRIRVLDITFI